MMGCLSCEDEVIQAMNAAKVEGLPAVLEAAGPKGHRLAAGVFQASQLVVTADLRFREAERVEALGLDPGRATTVRELAKFRNDACLEVLEEEVVPAIAAVREEFGHEREIDTKRAFDFFEAESREALARTDLNGRRAAMAGRVIDRTRWIADEAGIDGLCTVLERRCARLIELRREREEHNNPVGVAIGAAIAATGFLILGICSALSQGRPCRSVEVDFIARLHIMGGLFIMLAFAGGEEDGQDEVDEDGFGEGPL
jgi:hypothetical protein